MSGPPFSTIRYDVEGPVATITLARPDAANAQNSLLIDELDAAFDCADADDGVRVVVLAHAGALAIDLAGEVGGIVRDPALTKWREIDLANGAFGQGVAVTPIQLATAYAGLMNGGTLVQPHVVKSVGDNDVLLGPRRQGIIDTSVSRTLIQMMEHVITEVPFYRDRTLVPGYDVGGKTGTAQIWDASANGGRGAWKRNLFNYSFVGYIGRQTGVPDLVVAIRIEEGTPTVARVGHLEMPVMSFELFRRIATDAITTPDLLADRPVTLTRATDR